MVARRRVRAARHRIRTGVPGRAGYCAAMPRPVSLRPVVPALYSLALAVVVLGPLLVSPGYLLLRDAVSTPRSFLTDSALGLTDAAARNSR